MTSFRWENIEISEDNLTSMFRTQVVEDYFLKVEAEIASEVSGRLFSDRHVIYQNSWMFASLTSHILCLGLYGCEMPILVALRSKGDGLPPLACWEFWFQS